MKTRTFKAVYPLHNQDAARSELKKFVTTGTSGVLQ